MINWHGYLIKEDGSILNKDGTVKTLKVTPKGYLHSSFYYNGKLTTHLIHRLVAEAYYGPCPKGLEVDHKDNDRQNNHKDNLRYVTKAVNNQKSYTSGNRDVSGENNANSKYSEEEIHNLIRLRNQGFSYGKLVAMTGINKGTVAKVAKGHHYFCGTFRD